METPRISHETRKVFDEHSAAARNIADAALHDIDAVLGAPEDVMPEAEVTQANSGQPERMGKVAALLEDIDTLIPPHEASWFV